MNAAEAAAELMGVAPAGLSEAATALGQRASDPTTLDLSKLSEKLSLTRVSRAPEEHLAALASRVVAAREKIAKAKTLGTHTAEQIKTAERKLAELDDELTDEMAKEARWYACDVAYLIGREFLRRLHRTSEGGTLTIHLPAVGQSFTLALDGEDDEPPF